MLSWWMGKPPGPNGNPDLGDREFDIDPPDTPAPVFAARALKSAFFGTPGLPDDDTCVVIDTEKKYVSKVTEQRSLAPATAADGVVALEPTKLQPRSLSPSKPPGILMTPGTATARRKAVSFHHEIVDKEERNGGTKGQGLKRITASVEGSKKPTSSPWPGKGRTSTEGLEDRGKKPTASPWPAKESGFAQPTRRTPLAQKLEDAREVTARTTVNHREMEATRTSSENQNLLNSENSPSDWQSNVISPYRYALGADDRKTGAALTHTPRSQQPAETCSDSDVTGEMTLDMNDPRSKSGRWWKAEYEQYHKESLQQMDKLVGYKKLAKSYAKTKDDEAVDLAAKLKEEQEKVAGMEDQLSKFAAHMAAIGLDGADRQEPDSIKKLARQTALTVQYKQHVEELKDAMEEAEDSKKTPCQKRTHSSRTERDDEAQQKLISLRAELETVQRDLKIAQKANENSEKEKATLTRELLHSEHKLQIHMEQCEIKRRNAEERRQTREEAMKALQSDYDKFRETARTQRRDAELLLKKRNEQVVAMKKEIASMKGTVLAANEMQMSMLHQGAEHDQTVAHYKKEIEALIKEPKSSSDEPAGGRTLHENVSAVPPPSGGSPPKGSFIATPRSILRPSKYFAPGRQSRSHAPSTLRKPASHSALSEIINRADAETVPPPGLGPVQNTPLPSSKPLTRRFSTMSMETSALPLPSPEASRTLSTVSRPVSSHEKNCKPSPRPSMFNVASSPPKAAFVRNKRSSKTLSADSIRANISSSRLTPVESTKAPARGNLSSEKHAAALARLAEKKAAKQRAQGQENIR